MVDVMMAVVVFFACYHIIKEFTNFLLKRKIIKSGHFEKAAILNDEPQETTPQEVNKYPSLKWGLVVFMAGLGLVLIEFLRYTDRDLINYTSGVLPIGIELVFISLGFLIYFFIVNFSKKK